MQCDAERHPILACLTGNRLEVALCGAATGQLTVEARSVICDPAAAVGGDSIIEKHVLFLADGPIRVWHLIFRRLSAALVVYDIA